MGRSKLNEQILQGMAVLTEGNIYYIRVPWKELSKLLLRITLLSVLPYLLTANIFMFAFLIPAYLYFAYINHIFYCMVKRYGFKWLPTALIIVAVNLCCFFFASILRGILIHIIFM